MSKLTVAVMYKKIEIGNNTNIFLFNPVDIMIGKIGKTGLFIPIPSRNNTETKYYPLESCELNSEYYYGLPKEVSELKKEYSDAYDYRTLTNEEVIDFYREDYFNYVFVGEWDNRTRNIYVRETDPSTIYTGEYSILDTSDDKQDCDQRIEFKGNQNDNILPKQTYSNQLQFLGEEEIYKCILSLEQLKELEEMIQSNPQRAKKILLEMQTSLKEMQASTLYENSINDGKKINKLTANFDLIKMREYIKRVIVAQDDAIDLFTARLGINFTATNPLLKSHILMYGASGMGKTEIVKLASEFLKIPFYKVDSTQFTQEGYVGHSVDEMIEGLIEVANGDIYLAQNGILFIDEIDKKADNYDRGISSTKAVLDSLLKITGKSSLIIKIKGKDINFDTSNLTVICSGAFIGIGEQKNKSIGFVRKDIEKEKVSLQSFLDYGMTTEFMGRVSCQILVKSYTYDDYIRILKESETSPLRLALEYFKQNGISTSISENYYALIAKRALELGTGVRGLKSACDETLLCVAPDILCGNKIKSLTLGDTITKK